MALPSATSANFPQGFSSVIINAVTYAVNSCDLASQTTRQITRTDSKGDYADSQTRASAEPITGTMELQKATITTAFPKAGRTFVYDFDDSGTDSLLEVTDVKAVRSKDEAHVFEIGVKVLELEYLAGV